MPAPLIQPTWSRPVARKLFQAITGGALYASEDVREWRLTVRVVRQPGSISFSWHARPLLPEGSLEAHGTCRRIQDACDAVCRALEAFSPRPEVADGRLARLKKRLQLVLQ